MKIISKHKIFILSILFSVVFLQSFLLNAQTTWTPQNSAENNDWRSVTYGNGLFVAVAYNGTNRVMTSPDGVNWTSGNAAAQNEWTSVTYGNGLFVAVAESGSGNRVMTSPNGIDWTIRNSAADNWWRSVTYGDGLFVAVSYTGANQVMTSPDGTNWTLRNAAAENEWTSVTYGNKTFVAVSESGDNRVMTSTNGIDWVSRTVVNNWWRSVTYGNGLFVAVAYSGANRVMTSSDGVDWALHPAGSNQWTSITYGNGTFVAVADNGSGNRVMTSTNGINWTNRTSARDYWWNSVTYANGLFVAVSGNGGSNGIMTSGNLIIPPSLSTATQFYVAANSAILGGNISSDGGASVTERGIVWATTANPTISNNKVQIGSVTNPFGAEVIGLPSNTLIYVRAYATNSVGTAYGNQISFTTLTALSSLSTATASDISATSASLGGNISNSGGGNVIERGIVWATTTNPTISNNKVQIGSGTGFFSQIVSGLPPGTLIYTRAYAINAAGTAYGNQVSFSTIIALSSLSTAAVANITIATATLGGNITADGGASITERGIVWATSADPTVTNNKVQIGSGTGSFSETVSGLPPGTLIYVRAYATNAAGTAYGNEISFTALLPDLPTLSTAAATNISPFYAILGGNITADGGANVTERGIAWATTTNPTISNNKAQIASGTGSFSQTVYGMPPGTLIYVRAYATNAAGTAYGNQISFMTQIIDPPPLPPINPPMLPVTLLATLGTTAATNISTTTATLGGNITANGGASVTERGIVWATSANPTTANNKVHIGSGTGSFSQNITDLPENTMIYVRAYAINSAGTAYGNEVSFTTQNTLPVSLLSYTAKTVNNHAQLQWQTASETNNKGFIIYRSSDDGLFVKLGEVRANDYSPVLYTFTDNRPLNGNNYYKLIQVDNDGTTTELGIRSLVFGLSALGLKIYPNPTTNQVTVSFPIAKYNTLTITDIIGKQLQRIAINATESHKEVSLAAYPTGVYVVQLSGNGQTDNKRIIKK